MHALGGGAVAAAGRPPSLRSTHPPASSPPAATMATGPPTCTASTQRLAPLRACRPCCMGWRGGVREAGAAAAVGAQVGRSRGGSLPAESLPILPSPSTHPPTRWARPPGMYNVLDVVANHVSYGSSIFLPEFNPFGSPEYFHDCTGLSGNGMWVRREGNSRRHYAQPRTRAMPQ